MSKKSIKLNFTNYEVIRMSLSKAKTFEENSEELGFMFKIAPNVEQEYEKVNVFQGVSLLPSKEFPYNLEVIIKGNFIVRNCDSDEDKSKFLTVNASAILFPYLRSIVSLITSQVDYDKVLLPVMNFHKVFKDVNMSEVMLPTDKFEDFE
tara:strand:- start:173 stop:622 length:450 start_codon:yes stop_codon:yes gene_type:complete